MLPPAGDAISLVYDDSDNQRLLADWQPYRPAFYASGTAALAAAMGAALAARPGRSEVVLPGYGCPALVSAVLYAGGRPVLVDLEPDRSWLALPALAAAVGPRTAAVVAVNLLGIPERLPALAKIAHRAGAMLIEDSAQAYPPADLDSDTADLIVLSFGRGKPVSLLGGGAILCRDPHLAATLPCLQPPPASRWRVRAKIEAYNWLRRPQFYWIPHRLPLGLGETLYQPLAAVAGMDAVRRRALGAAVRRYRQRQNNVQPLLRQRLTGLGSQLTDLAVACAPEARLLRYPLLAPTAAAAANMARELTKAGLGASRMYGSVLPDVKDMPAGLLHGELPHARDFAARLLTLPVHGGVAPSQVERMCAMVEAALQEGEVGILNQRIGSSG